MVEFEHLKSPKLRKDFTITSMMLDGDRSRDKDDEFEAHLSLKYEVEDDRKKTKFRS